MAELENDGASMKILKRTPLLPGWQVQRVVRLNVGEASTSIYTLEKTKRSICAAVLIL